MTCPLSLRSPSAPLNAGHSRPPVSEAQDTPHYFLTSVSAARSSLDLLSPLANLTGTGMPRSRGKGFRLRLNYDDKRNVTTWSAKSWRVRWVAVSEKAQRLTN